MPKTRRICAEIPKFRAVPSGYEVPSSSEAAPSLADQVREFRPSQARPRRPRTLRNPSEGAESLGTPRTHPGTGLNFSQCIVTNIFACFTCVLTDLDHNPDLCVLVMYALSTHLESARARAASSSPNRPLVSLCMSRRVCKLVQRAPGHSKQNMRVLLWLLVLSLQVWLAHRRSFSFASLRRVLSDDNTRQRRHLSSRASCALKEIAK